MINLWVPFFNLSKTRNGNLGKRIKDFYIKTKLYNIFETKNAIRLIKAILENPYKLQSYNLTAVIIKQLQ